MTSIVIGAWLGLIVVQAVRGGDAHIVVWFWVGGWTVLWLLARIVGRARRFNETVERSQSE